MIGITRDPRCSLGRALTGRNPEPPTLPYNETLSCPPLSIPLWQPLAGVFPNSSAQQA
jgi:hypothetical protein